MKEVFHATYCQTRTFIIAQILGIDLVINQATTNQEEKQTVPRTKKTATPSTTSTKEHNMKKRLQHMWWMVATMILMAPSLGLAAGGGGAPIVLVADTRKLDGAMSWWANLYNESHLYFALVTIVIIPVTGVIFGAIADVVMGWIGIDLKNRELAEH
jgi:hypothetical protein